MSADRKIPPIREDGLTACFARATRMYSSSKLHVKPHRENRDRTPIGVISWVCNQLVVQRNCRPLGDAVGVVGLEYLLVLVTEPTVANQYAETSGGKIGAGRRRNSFHHAAHADLVVGTSPGCPLQYGA